MLNLQRWDFSKGIKHEFETAVENEPSVFEPLKFYCNMHMKIILNSSNLSSCLFLDSNVCLPALKEIISHICQIHVCLQEEGGGWGRSGGAGTAISSPLNSWYDPVSASNVTPCLSRSGGSVVDKTLNYQSRDRNIDPPPVFRMRL